VKLLDRLNPRYIPPREPPEYISEEDALALLQINGKSYEQAMRLSKDKKKTHEMYIRFSAGSLRRRHEEGSEDSLC